MSKWSLVSLGDIADIEGGSTPRRGVSEYWDGEIYWVTPTDLPMPGEGIADISTTKDRITKKGLDSCSAKILPPGTVLFSSRATIGKLGIAKVPLATNQGFANFKPHEGINNRFLAYLLSYYTPEITKLAGSTTFREVTKGSLRKFKISLPPLLEQERIVHLLDEAQALRAARERANARMEQFIPALFQEIIKTSTCRVVKLGGILRQEKFALVDGPFGSSLKANEYTDSGVRVIRVNNIKPNWFNRDDVRYVSLQKYEALKRSTVKPGDLIMAKVGNTIGKTCMFPDEIPFALLTANVCKITLDENIVSSWYICYQMNTDYVQSQITNQSGNAGKPMINLSRIRDINLQIPPLALQREFAARVEAARGVQSAQGKSAERIEALYQSMLSRAFAP